MTLTKEQRDQLSAQLADLITLGNGDDHNAMYIMGLLSTALIKLLEHVNHPQARRLVVNDVVVRLQSSLQSDVPPQAN